MTDLVQALQNGTANLWIFIPTAILLGALHGLEPGHSKTMMAAFIIAIRGTVWQAVLLGLSAAISHSLLIWLLAALALHFGNQWNAETVEPYLQIVSALGILVLAAWMFLRTRREVAEAAAHNHAHHASHCDTGIPARAVSERGGGGSPPLAHSHDETFLLDTGHGKLELSVFEDGVPPVFRLRAPAGHRLPRAVDVDLETVHHDGSRQKFTFAAREGFLESHTPIPEPHEFEAVLTLHHGGGGLMLGGGHHHAHTCRAVFSEHGHSHSHAHGAQTAEEFQDAHERAHAEDIEKRFAGRAVTTPQIILFGITGGLMPCPAAFSVLLICLQLKKFTLGFAMVASFSFGLALTMVTTGAIAAWSVRHAQKRFKGFGELMRRAPYVSCVLLVLIAAYMAWTGWHGLTHQHTHP